MRGARCSDLHLVQYHTGPWALLSRCSNPLLLSLAALSLALFDLAFSCIRIFAGVAGGWRSIPCWPVLRQQHYRLAGVRTRDPWNRARGSRPDAAAIACHCGAAAALPVMMAGIPPRRFWGDRHRDIFHPIGPTILANYIFAGCRPRTGCFVRGVSVAWPPRLLAAGSSIAGLGSITGFATASRLRAALVGIGMAALVAANVLFPRWALFSIEAHCGRQEKPLRAICLVGR